MVVLDEDSDAPPADDGTAQAPAAACSSADDDGPAVPAATQPQQPPPMSATGLTRPSGSVAARYASDGERLGPTQLPPDVAQFVAGGSQVGASSYSPYKPPAPTPPRGAPPQRELPPPTPLPLGAPRRPSAQSRYG